MSRRRRLLRPVEVLESRFNPATVNWINPAGGDWETKSNWSTGSLPTAADDVFLFLPGAAGTITLASTQTVNSLTVDTTPLSLTIASGLLTIATTSTVPTTVNGGTLTVNGEQIGSVTLAGGGLIAANFTGYTLDVKTTTGFAGAINKFKVADGPDLTIAAGVNLVCNTATLNFPASTALTVLGTLSGSGQVNIPGGRLDIRGSIANTVQTNLTNATVSIRSGAATTISGIGTWSGVTYEVENAVDLPAGFLKLSTLSLLGNQTGVLKAGSSGVPAQFPVQLNNAVIASGGVTFDFPAGFLTWISGNFTGGSFTNLGQFTLNNASGVTNSSFPVNKGEFIHLNGNIVNTGTQTFTNATGAVYDIRAMAPSIDWGTFANHGRLLRSAGAGNATFIGGTFNSTGAIEVNTGTLTTSATGTTTGGAYTVALGATLDLLAGTYGGTITASGAGLLRVNTGFTAASGLVLNAATPGLLQWTGGAIAGGNWTNAGSLTINATTISTSSVVLNTGTVIHQAGTVGLSGMPSFTNAAGAVYDIRNNISANWGTFTNAGTLLRSAGFGSANVTASTNVFINSGVIDVQTGTLVTASGGTSLGGTFTVASGAILDLRAQKYSGTYTGSGAGLIRFAFGFFGEADCTFNVPTPDLLQWTGGTMAGTVTNLGSFTVAATASPGFAGTFTNSGTVIQKITSGTVSVGSSLTNLASGLFDIRGDIDLNWGTFSNFGTLRRSSGVNTSSFGASGFLNAGAIEVLTGKLNTGGSTAIANLGGTFTVAAGTTLDLGPQKYSGTYTGSGAGLIRVAGGLTAQNAVFNFPATDLFQWTGGSLAGTFTNLGSWTITGFNGNSGNVVNKGTVIHKTGNIAEIGTTSSFLNDVGATYDLRTTNTFVWGTFTNKGLIKYSGVGTNFFFSNLGTTSFINSDGSFDLRSGTLQINNPVNLGSGSLTGRGGFTATLTNPSGIVSPGIAPATGGITVTGYTQGSDGELKINIDGQLPSTHYDVLSVNAAPTLGGTLTVDPGFNPVFYIPAVGTKFTIVDNFSSNPIVGTFNNLPEGTLFTVEGYEFRISYLGFSGNDVTLTVTAVPPLVVSGFTVNGGAEQRSRLTTITVTTSAPFDTVFLGAPGAVTLTRTQGGPGTVVQSGATGNNGRITVTPLTTTSFALTFVNADGAGTSAGVEHGSLADGYWRLAIPQLNYVSPLNAPTLRRLFGDVNNDGTVDGSNDFAQFGNVFGVTLAAIPFDFNNDGTIDGSTDFAEFGARFGITI